VKHPIAGNVALFVLSRSQLHYCIQACALIFGQYRRGQIGAASAYDALSQLRSVTGLWGTVGGSRAMALQANGCWLFTSIDVTERVAGQCMAIGSYASRLKRYFARRHGHAIAAHYVEGLSVSAPRTGHGPCNGHAMSMMKCDQRIYLPMEGAVAPQRERGPGVPSMPGGTPWLDVVISARGRRR
jgi:hypothetical protein